MKQDATKMGTARDHEGREIREQGGGWGFRIFIIGCVGVLLAWPLWRLKRPGGSPAPSAVEVSSGTETPAEETGLPAEAVMAVRVEGPSAVEQQWGIQVASVHLALAGRALDVRYKVVDPEKALGLASGNTSICAVDEASGTRLAIPSLAERSRYPMNDRARLARQTGAFPPSPNTIAAERTNSVLLPNALQRVTNGSRVTVFVGEAKVEHVAVQ